MAAEWEHLQPLLVALRESGTAVAGPGFVPVQGGYECVMQRPLDFDVVRSVITEGDKNVHLGESSDLVWCSHCWASIIGPTRLDEVRQDPPQQR